MWCIVDNDIMIFGGYELFWWYEEVLGEDFLKKRSGVVDYKDSGILGEFFLVD